MTDALCVLLYTPLFVISLILTMASLRKDLRNRIVRRSVGFYFCMSSWVLCEIIYFGSRNPALMKYIMGLSMSFRAFSAVFLLLMVSGFYRTDRAISPRYISLLYLPAIVATVFAVVPQFQQVFFKTFDILRAWPVTQTVIEETTYFYIQVLYNQCLVVGMILILLISFGKLPQGYRSGSQLLFVGFAAYLVCLALELIYWREFPMNLMLVGGTFCGTLFYFTTLVSGRHDFLHIERRDVFHYLDEGIFILDENGVILDANRTAQELFDITDIKHKKHYFNQLLDGMIQTGRVVRRQPDEEPGEILCFFGDMIPRFYQMQRQPVSDGTANGGKCVILTDITNSQLFMERLIETAGVDVLTALPNRYRYQELLRELDMAENLPLSIIIGDVNGLKVVNDTMGHYMGDLLLKNVAEIMKDCCPPNGHLARIGGDEFVMLLPSCPQIGAEAIVREIIRKTDESVIEPAPSLALGSATKVNMSQNLNTLIMEADRKMYDDKREAKR